MRNWGEADTRRGDRNAMDQSGYIGERYNGRERKMMSEKWLNKTG